MRGPACSTCGRQGSTFLLVTWRQVLQSSEWEERRLCHLVSPSPKWTLPVHYCGLLVIVSSLACCMGLPFKSLLLLPSLPQPIPSPILPGLWLTVTPHNSTALLFPTAAPSILRQLLQVLPHSGDSPPASKWAGVASPKFTWVPDVPW